MNIPEDEIIVHRPKKKIMFINDEDIFDQYDEDIKKYKTYDFKEDTKTLKFTSWKKINELLLKKISNVKIFDDFDVILSKLTNEEKGKFFESFSKGYLSLIPSFKNIYEKVYLYDEIPVELKYKLNLPSQDKGIDGLIITKDNKNIAFQVKYRSNKETISFGELATFPALTFGTNCKLDGGLFFTSCYEVCNEIRNDKYINITNSHFDKCDEEFWNIFREFIKNQKITEFKKLIPLPHQEKKILPLIKKYFENNNYGRIYLPCGTGKTVIGNFTAINILNCNSIYIAVPSLYLLSETYETWAKQLYGNKDYVFLLIGSDMDKKEDLESEYSLTIDLDIITDFIKFNKTKKPIVITTYQSSHILKDACKSLKFKFDLGIFDEAHRTVGQTNKTFTNLLSDKSTCHKRLFMTATERIYNYNMSKLTKEKQEEILSMDNENIYGQLICNYSTRQAINDEQLVDYNIIAPFIMNNNFRELSEQNKFIKIDDSTEDIRLFLTACLIVNTYIEGDVKHLLVFANTNKTSERLMELICKFLEKENIKEDVFTKFLSGNDNMNKRKSQVNIFSTAKRGIICSARIFGEGVNIPICDAVCFADNKTSTVDIIQYVGRCLRLCKEKPNKISTVIIPFIIDELNDFLDNKKDSYFQLRSILKSLGTTDEIVSEKFVLQDCNKLVSSGKTRNKPESISTEIYTEIIDLKEFRQSIITKIFDKTGEPEARIRNKLIYENKRRNKNDLNLLDTRTKCLEFLKQEGEKYIPLINNWIKYCLGNDWFDELKKKYHYTKNDLKNSFKQLNMIDFVDYKDKYKQDSRLPSPDYINNGFYYDLDSKFDIVSLMQEDMEIFEY